MQKAFHKIVAKFPDRSLVIRSGSDASYFVLKSWYQLFLITSVLIAFLWILVASIGFFVNYTNLVATQVELQQIVAKNEAFIEQLESDQANAYQLRQQYQAEIGKNLMLAERYESIKSISEDAVEDQAPENAEEFVAWFRPQLVSRIYDVDQRNENLSSLVMDLSSSVAEISGHPPPESIEEVDSWLEDVAGDLTDAYQAQSEAMEKLYQIFTKNLVSSYATIEETPLAAPDIAGFSPAFGTGGPESLNTQESHVFQRFENRARDLKVLSQDWEQLQQLLSCAPLSTPVDYYNLTSKFGNRKDPFTGRPDWHEGIDMGAWPGTKVRTTAAGTVRFAGPKGGYGRLIVIDHGCGIETAYGHLKSINVKKGQIVSYRDVIGAVGSAGRSTGPHVHYEVRVRDKPVDPYQFIEAGRYVFKEQKPTIAIER